MDLLESHFATLRDGGNLYYDVASDTYEMFSNKGIPNHINYLTFKELFKRMEGMKNPLIIETGIASAGTYSTVLFNEYIRKYGGLFWSVDINKGLVDYWSDKMCPATTLIHDDSASFLAQWADQNPGGKADVVYLDSYDLDFYDPVPSADHGLKEYNAIKPALGDGTLLLIDDTPLNPYWLNTRDAMYDDMIAYYDVNKRMPGKGMYVLDEIPAEKKVLHTYQVLYAF